MLPIRLEIKNFLAYRSPDPVYFDGIHLACITGPNGAGKSSLLDAITWALWGEARTRRAEDLIHQGQTDMYVQLDFEQEGVIYRVLRRRTRRGGSAGTLDLFVLKDGQPKTINEGNMRATQTKIDGILRMDYDTFVHSAFLQQGKADSFTTKPPAERKKILADILGLARWEAYEERVKERLKAIEKDLAQIDAIIQQIDTELAQEPGLRAQLVEAERQQQEAQAALDAAEARLAEVAGAPADLRAAQERKASLEAGRRNHEKDLSAADTEIKFQQRRIAEYEAVIAVRADIEAGYAALQTARETHTALGDKLRQLNVIDARRSAIEGQIQAARAELERELSGGAATIAQLQRLIDSAQSDELSEVRAELLALEALETQHDQMREALVNLEKEQAELKAINKALHGEMNDLKDRIDRLSAAEGAACPLCGQPLDEAHRLRLIDELQNEGTVRGDTFRANEARVKAIAAELKQGKQAAADVADELKRLAALKERAAALQAGVDAANEAAAHMNEEYARLEVYQQMLDADDFAHELRAQLADIEAERAALGYDDSLHDAARAQLDTYREYESRQKDLEIALKSLPDVQARLDSALAGRERLLRALEEDRAALEANAAEIGQLEALVREYHQREGEVKIQRTNERTAYGRLVDARQALDALERQRERKAQKEAQRIEKRAEQALYDELKLAFGKNGIPAMIIETAIPELEVSANHLLSRMTDGRMNLALRTQREKITGGVAETLEIDIADELGTRAYEMYSGGEAFRINFAIRVALSQLLARRAGAHLRTLFLDEGFGTQDEDGRNKLVEAITAVQDDFAMILVITHIDDLRDSFPVHILLEKTGDGSRVSVR